MGRAGRLGRAGLSTLLLGAGLVLLGSPWMREPLYEFEPDSPLENVIHRSLYLPTWDLSPSSHGLSEPLYLAGNTALLVLLAGVVLAPRPLTRTTAPAGLRWLAAFGSGVLLSLIAAVASWAAVKADGEASLSYFASPTNFVIVNFVVDGLVFGVLLGLALGLLTVPSGAGSRTAALSRVRIRERSSTMAPSTSEAPGGAVGDTAPGDTTRHLCAAAYTDPEFTRRVVEDVLRDELGAVAPSPGVDLVPVVRHSLAARRLHRARDRQLALVYLLIAAFGPLWLLYGSFALRSLAGASRPPRQTARGREPVDTAAAVRRLVGTGAGVLLAGILFALFLSALPLSGVWSWLAGSYAGGVPALLAVVGGGGWAYWIMARAELDTDRRLRDSLRRENFVPEGGPEVTEAWSAAGVRAVAEAQSGNVTVYSGFSPFVGQGVQQSQWALSLPLLPAQPGAPLTGFDTWDVVERLRARLREAAQRPPADGGPSLAALEVEDRVFVSGTRLAGDRLLLPAPVRAPVTRLSDDAVRAIALDPQGTPRHCLAAHLPLWGGAVVPSQLLHIAVVGRTLHLHCDRHVLTPLRPDLRGVDTLPSALTPAHRAGVLLTALRRSGGALFGAPRAVLGDALRDWGAPRRQRRERAAAQTDPAFDRGARMSIREYAMSAEYLDHFQRVDAERAFAALDRHALAAVRDFLDEHGVDTADFRTQTQTILNHGVLQTGGVSVVGNQAVGTGAQATTGTATATAPAPQ
nr:hypothetical protein SBE_002557 [Streptomyces sp. SBE_14.2]